MAKKKSVRKGATKPSKDSKRKSTSGPVVRRPSKLADGKLEIKLNCDVFDIVSEKKDFTVCVRPDNHQALYKRLWLWRSSIKNYDRDCFYFRRWLSRMLFERRSWMNGAGTTPLCQLFDLDSVGKIIELSRRTNGPFSEPQLSQLGTSSEPLGKNGLSKSGLEVFDRLLAIVSAALRE